MRQKFYKVLWLVGGILAITSCHKNKDVTPTPPVTDQNKVVFIGDESGKMYALNAQTGAEIWSYESSLGRTSGITRPHHTNQNIHSRTNTVSAEIWYPPAISGTNLVFANNEPKMFDLNITTGAKMWSVAMDAWLPYGDCAPIIKNNVAYMGAYERLFGYSLDNGATVLDVNLGESVNSVNYVNNMLIANTCYGHLFAIDPATGNQIWHFNPGSDCFHTNPSFGNNLVYIASSDGEVYAVNLTSGEQAWHVAFEDAGNASIAFINNLVYLASPRSNRILALDANSGVLMNSYSVPDGKEFPWGAGAAIVNGMAYAASSDGVVYAIDIASATIKWEKDLNLTEITGSVVAANGYLYIGGDSEMYALDPANGSIKWQKTLNDFIYASPVILTNMDKVYRSSNTGIVQ